MCGCESWTTKKAECRRIVAFELWRSRRLSNVPRTARRSNQSILKEINPEYSLEGLILQLKLQYFDHLMQRANSLEKTLMLGKTGGRRRRGWQRMRWLDGITDLMDMYTTAQSCLCNPIDCSMPGFSVHHQLPELTLTHSSKSVMLSNHLTLWPLLLPSVFPSIMVFSNELVLRIRWPKFWSFSFNYQSFQWIFRVYFL